MININLIAERRARKIREMRIIRWAGMGVFIIALCLVAINMLTWVNYGRWQNEERRADIELKQMRTSFEELSRVEREIAEKQPRVQMLQQVRISEAAWITLLSDVSEVMPPEVSLANLTPTVGNTGMTLKISGVAPDYDTAARFMRTLNAEKRWALTATLNSVAAQSSNGAGVRFDLTVPVRDMSGGSF